MSHSNTILGINNDNIPYYLGSTDAQIPHYQIYIASGWFQLDFITFRKQVTMSSHLKNIFVIGLNKFQRLIQFVDISSQNNHIYAKIIYADTLQDLITQQNITLQCQPHIKQILNNYQLKIGKFRLQNFDWENNVPIVFSLLLNKLKNVKEEGLFRKSPDMQQFEKFWSNLLVGQYEQIDQIQDIHMITQSIKRFLMLLHKEGSLIDDPQNKELLNKLQKILQNLMQNNNEITVENLGILLNPCLLNVTDINGCGSAISMIQTMNDHLKRTQEFIRGKTYL